jgi:hypothetical protein
LCAEVCSTTTSVVDSGVQRWHCMNLKKAKRKRSYRHASHAEVCSGCIDSCNLEQEEIGCKLKQDECSNQHPYSNVGVLVSHC